MNSARTVVLRTRFAVATTIRRRDARFVLMSVTIGYFLTYLWAVGHLAPGLGGYELMVVADPVEKFFQPALGPFSFRPIARARLGPVTYLFSLNSVIGLCLAVLVGANMSLTFLAWRRPAACGIGGSSAGLLASVPALLSGTACCGPVVLLVFGIQASSLILTAFQYLLPVAALALVGSLLLIARQFQPRDAGS